MFRTLFSLLLFASFTSSAAVIEIRRAGGGTVVAEATNAIGNFNGSGTNTTLVGNTVVTGSPDIRGTVDAAGLNVTNTATFLGTGVANTWLFQDTVTSIGLITALGGVDASGQTVNAGTVTASIANITTLNAPRAFTNANTLFVHKGGNDTTGIRGGLGQYGFLTLTGAQAKAVSGDIIVVYPGTYTQHTLGKDGVDWYFHTGTILDPGTNLFVFSSTNFASGSFNVFGNADVTNGFLQMTNGNVYAEALNIRAPKASSAIYIGDGALFDGLANARVKVKNQVMGEVICFNTSLHLTAHEYYLANLSLAYNFSTAPIQTEIIGDRFIRSTLKHDGDAANCRHKTNIRLAYVKGPNTGDWDVLDGFALHLSDGTAHVLGGYFVSGSSGNLMLVDAGAANSTLSDLTLIQTNGVSNIVNNSGGTAFLNVRGTLRGNTLIADNFDLRFSSGEFWYNPLIIDSWEQ